MESPPSKWTAFWREIRRRHVVRVTIAYVIAALAVLEGADVILPTVAPVRGDDIMRVLVVLAILGLPVIVALAWVYDLTPWGVQRTEPIVQPESAGVVDVDAPTEAPEPGHPTSVAVLPFIDLSTEQDQEYFADGVAEELINQLTQRTDLRVAARTSSFAYRGEERDIRDIGRELGVASVLEGSVRKAGGSLRITAQLVSVTDGYHLWSERYDRDEGDIFKIQDDIAGSVTGLLQASLRPGVPEDPVGPGTDDPEAYDLYLQGRHLWTRRYRLGLEHAVGYFQRAAERDPEFPLAHAGLADCFTAFGIYSFLPGPEAEVRAVAAAGRALDLGPRQPLAHVAWGRAAAFFLRDWEDAEGHHLRALELDPSDGEIMASAAQLSLFRGRRDEALSRADRAVELAPDSSFAGAIVGAVYLYSGQVERAIDHLKALRDRDPEHTPTLFILGEAVAEAGDPAEGVRYLEEAVTMTHRAIPFLAALGSIRARAGREEAAREILDELERRSAEEFVTPIARALVHAGLGEGDEAFRWFREGMEVSRPTVTQTIRDPGWSALHGDPRWAGFLEEMGLGADTGA